MRPAALCLLLLAAAAAAAGSQRVCADIAHAMASTADARVAADLLLFYRALLCAV